MNVVWRWIRWFALGLFLAGCGKPPVDISGKAWIPAQSGGWISNPAFTRRVLDDGSIVELPAQHIPASKAPGEIRIAVFGGAGASGIPAGYISLARVLEASLEGGRSNRSFCVLDTAMPGLSAPEITDLIRQTESTTDVDVVILYPDAAHLIGTSGEKQDVQAVLSSWIAAAREKGARVVLCFPGSNIADCPPFRSVENPEEQESLAALLKAADAGDWADVLESSREVIEKNPSSALAYYLRGQALRARSDLVGAASNLIAAVEHDLSQRRLPPSIFAEFQALEASDVRVIHGNAAFGKYLPGIFSAPGAEAFETESMPGIEGWRALGAVVSRSILRMFDIPIGEDWIAEAADFQRHLGYTSVLSAITLNRLVQHFEAPEYSSLWHAAARQRALRERLRLLQGMTISEATMAPLLDAMRLRISEHPDDLRLREVLALHLIAMNQGDAAIHELEDLLTRYPNGLEARTMLCRLLLQNGQADKALALANALAADAPHWPVGRILKAQALSAAHQFDELLTFLEPQRNAPEPNPDLLAILANGYTALRRTNDAVAVLAEASHLDPRRADILLASAEIAIQRGNANEAMNLLERARRAAPDAPEVDETSAILFARINDFPRAIALLRRAEKNAPGRPRTQQLLQEALTLQDKNARQLFEQAGELRKKGDDAGAITLYRRALDIHPTAPSLLENLAFLLATSRQDALRNGPEALRLARMRIEQMGDKPSPEACATLAAALAETGDFAGAVAQAERALGIATRIKDFNPSRIQEALAAYRNNTCWRNR